MILGELIVVGNHVSAILAVAPMDAARVRAADRVVDTPIPDIPY